MERILDLQEKKAIALQKKITFQERKRIVTLFDEAEAMREKLLTEDAFTPEKYDAVVSKYRTIVAEYPGDKMAIQSVSRLDELEKIKAEKMTLYKKQKAYQQTGKLVEYKDSRYPSATHKLVSGGPLSRAPVCALFSTNIDLRAFEKERVILQGRKVIDKTEEIPYPLIEVTSIKLKNP